MKKTWIMLKRGLIDDPRHRAAMGIRIWLYFHIIDRANWPDGVVYDWKDAAEAEAMKMPLATVRLQRRELEEAGYIRAIRKGDHLDIAISKWVNPREYTGQVYNTADVAGTSQLLSDRAIGRNPPLSETGPSKSDNESDRSIGRSIGNRPAAFSGPSISLTDHISQDHMQEEGGSLAASKDQTPWVQVLAILRRGMDRAEFDTWVQPTELLDLAGDTLTVACANAVQVGKLENGHRAEIEAAVREVIGRPVRVRFVVTQAVEA